MALVKAEELEGMGANRKWTPKNEEQALFLKKYFEPMRGAAVTIPEIESMVSRSAEEINAFLAAKGFTIKLEPFNPLEFGTASVLDLLLKWRVEGIAKPIIEFGTTIEHPGVRIASENALFYEASCCHRFPIAGLLTKSGDTVYMTIAQRAPQDQFELMEKIEKIEAEMVPYPEFGGIHFPMVCLQKEGDLSWLLGMKTIGDDGQPARISQALMEAIAKMNQIGVLVKIAVAAGIEKCCLPPKPKEDLVIDRPFLFWIRRKALKLPLACAFFTQEDWKDPENIES